MGLQRAAWVILATLTSAACCSAHPQAEEPAAEARYRFLVVIPLGGLSPTMDVLAIAAALALRGHHLSVVVPQDDMHFSTRAASRHGGGNGASLLEWLPYDMPFTLMSDELRNMAATLRGLGPVGMLRNVQRIWSWPCELLMANETLFQTLEATRYDAMMSFAMPGDDTDSCACLVSHRLRLPVVSVYAIPFLTAPLGVPQFGSGLNTFDLETLRGRAKNLAYFAGTRFMTSFLAFMGGRTVAPLRAAYGLPRGSAKAGGGCEPLVRLMANSFHFEAPRPVGPPEVLIGPIAPRAARPNLEPPSAAEFVNGAPAGVAVVSFGSAPVFGNFLEPSDITELALAFADVAPLRVLWLLRRRNLPGNLTMEDIPFGPNTQTEEWVDINDLLGHPNVKLFITHGGIHSSYEAVFHGKPFIGVPFQFEQKINGFRLQALGMGEVSPEAPPCRKKGETYTRAGMAGLIKKVMGTPSYAEAAARISKAARLQAALRPPLRLAVEEVEMAMVHRNYGRWRPYSLGRAPGGAGKDRTEL